MRRQVHCLFLLFLPASKQQGEHCGVEQFPSSTVLTARALYGGGASDLAYFDSSSLRRADASAQAILACSIVVCK